MYWPRTMIRACTGSVSALSGNALRRSMVTGGSMATLKILAPVDGWCAPLEEVPDAVFSGRMLGDGVAIDPTSGTVLAPCDGEVIAAAAGAHAVSIRATGGVEVLVHVGIDTVKLAGRGFQMCARVGQAVRAGDELLRFDLEVLARTAKSLLTAVLITAAPGVEIVFGHATGPVRAGEVLLDVAVSRPVSTVPTSATVSALTSVPTPAETVTDTAIVELRHGLHARPAALLVQRLRGKQAEVSICARGKSANARSAVALMSLGVRWRDQITVQASAATKDIALAALAEVTAALQEALRLESAEPSQAAGKSTSQSLAISGAAAVIAVPGFAVGRVMQMKRQEIVVVEAGSGIANETKALTQAQIAVRAQLARVSDSGSAAHRAIVGTHLKFLDDPLLNETAAERIAAGKSAAFAWRASTQQAITHLEALDDVRLRERADDLRDVESHLLTALQGEAQPLKYALPEHAVVTADELLPSELLALDRERLAAICLSGGGATSHVAILAAAMNVPMLVGLGSDVLKIPDGTTVIVDAEQGQLHSTPAVGELQVAQTKVSEQLTRQAAALAAAQSACQTSDGVAVAIYANVGSIDDALAAVVHGAEGCGLLRTEFLFLDRESAPDEAEQLQAYQAVADAMSGRPLVLRLMDIGGDKPLSYLPLPAEANPALGLRGIRTALRRTDLLHTQLRAALRVQPSGIVQILLPMITDVSEVRAVRAAISELCAELGRSAPISLGAMIETPAAALLAGSILAESDFLSIGSNDLSQYTLAMDRGHPELSRRIDALHPAVLKLIATAAAAGTAAGRLVAVCGGVAADPSAVPILIGLGIRELSVVPAAIPALKRQIGALTLVDCQAHAAHCLGLTSAAEVRAAKIRMEATP